MIDQSEILSRSQVQFITLFFADAELGLDVYAVPTWMQFPIQDKPHEFGTRKTTFLS
jgi:hypothetical protein